MSVNIAPSARLQYVDSSGDPVSGGLLYTYTAGTTTNETTYTTSAGDTANDNPIVLNSSGYTPNGVWLTSGTSYKFVLKDSDGNTLWSEDNVVGVNDTSTSFDEWVAGPSPTYVSGTQFTLTGDQTSEFHVGRRLKITDSGGTDYAVITVSAYTTLTTVTVSVDDSGSIDSGLSAVSYSLLSSDNPAVPQMEDDKFFIIDPTDLTKKARFDVGAITTGTTRTITIPDSSFTLGPTTVGKQTIWVPASAMTPTVSNGCAALTSVETTAGRPDMTVLDFDTSTDEHAQFYVAFPKSWNESTVTAQFYWLSTATDTDGVTWGIQGVAISDGDTMDVAYGTAVTVDDANQSTAEDLYVTSETSAITIGGTPAAGDMCCFRVFRDVSDANDTAAEDARLVGVKLYFTTDTGEDT